MNIKMSILLIMICLVVSGCVNQTLPSDKKETSIKTSIIEKSEHRIVATSHGTSLICDALELDLVGIGHTSRELPERYKDKSIVEVGSPMQPNYELITSLNPTDVLGPISLEETLKPKYEALGLKYTFLDLRSVKGLYDSIEMLGKKYNKQELVGGILNNYYDFINSFKSRIKDKEKPSVLLLMGFPGSYCEITQNAYIGNLLEISGAKNIVSHEYEEFVTWNTEELVNHNPDYILWTAHAFPEEVNKMIEEDFETNDVWKNFDAVKNGNVIYLDNDIFSMSANFRWKEGLEFLYDIFYKGK